MQCFLIKLESRRTRLGKNGRLKRKTLLALNGQYKSFAVDAWRFIKKLRAYVTILIAVAY